MLHHYKRVHPLQIQFELTNQCNNNCKFCYSGHSLGDAPLPTALKILDRLKNQGVMRVNLTGGEPLLHSNFKEICSASCKYFETYIITNGTLIDKELAAFLVNAGVSAVSISFLGLKETHESLTRVPGSFQRALNAIRIMRETNIALSCNVTLTQENHKELTSILDFLSSEKIYDVTITRFESAGIGKFNKELNVTNDEFINVICLCIERKKQKKLTPLIITATPFCGIPFDYPQDIIVGCNYGYDRFYLSPIGDLMICGSLRIPLGNVLTQSFNEIFKDSAIAQMYENFTHIPKECLDCKKLLDCRGGCRSMAYNTYNKINAPDPLAKIG